MARHSSCFHPRGLISFVALLPLLVPAVAPAAQTPAQPVATCEWTDTWDSNWGEMHLRQTGSTVTGEYASEQGELIGTVTGNVLTGIWTEAPTRQAPSDAGDFTFEMVDGSGCRSFTGTWRYGFSGEWVGDWDAERRPARQLGEIPTWGSSRRSSQ